MHNWKARWFVLTSDKLRYYKYEGGKRDSCQRGAIVLRDCEVTCPFLEYENRPVSLPYTLCPSNCVLFKLRFVSVPPDVMFPFDLTEFSGKLLLEKLWEVEGTFDKTWGSTGA